MRYYFINHTPCKCNYEKSGCAEISKEQYDSLISAIEKFDLVAPEGKYYRLEVDGTWALYDLPIVETIAEEATEADYQTALAEMGVDLNG